MATRTRYRRGSGSAYGYGGAWLRSWFGGAAPPPVASPGAGGAAANAFQNVQRAAVSTPEAPYQQLTAALNMGGTVLGKSANGTITYVQIGGMVISFNSATGAQIGQPVPATAAGGGGSTAPAPAGGATGAPAPAGGGGTPTTSRVGQTVTAQTANGVVTGTITAEEGGVTTVQWQDGTVATYGADGQLVTSTPPSGGAGQPTVEPTPTGEETPPGGPRVPNPFTDGTGTFLRSEGTFDVYQTPDGEMYVDTSSGEIHTGSPTGPIFAAPTPTTSEAAQAQDAGPTDEGVVLTGGDVGRDDWMRQTPESLTPPGSPGVAPTQPAPGEPFGPVGPVGPNTFPPPAPYVGPNDPDNPNSPAYNPLAPPPAPTIEEGGMAPPAGPVGPKGPIGFAAMPAAPAPAPAYQPPPTPIDYAQRAGERSSYVPPPEPQISTQWGWLTPSQLETMFASTYNAPPEMSPTPPPAPPVAPSPAASYQPPAYNPYGASLDPGFTDAYVAPPPPSPYGGWGGGMY